MAKTLTPKKILAGINRPLDVTKSEADLITEVVGERKLREAAGWFNENLPKEFQRSHMSVKYWQDGEYKPDDVFLYALKTYYEKSDPRHQLALDILTLRESANGDDVPEEHVGYSKTNGKKLFKAISGQRSAKKAVKA